MIGIGKWQAEVSTMMIRAKGVVEVIDNNGKYDFRYELPDRFKGAKIKYYDIREIGTDTLTGKGEISLLPGKVIEVTATFKGEKMTGVIKVPVMGGLKIQIRNGRRIG